MKQIQIMESLYKEIIREETIFFRGVQLGISIPEVEEIEGTKNKKRTGSNPSLHYKWETGEAEDINLYFGLDKEEKVNRVKLMFYSYPGAYYNQLTKGTLGDFVTLVNQNNIKEFSTLPYALTEKMVKMFTENIGNPSIEDKDEVFNKDHQNFNRWVWIDENHTTPLRLSLTRYLDDSDYNNIKWVISLLMLENVLV